MLRIEYKLKDQIIIDGEIHDINASFDVILRLIELLEDKNLIPANRVNVGLELLLGQSLDEYNIKDKATILREILDVYVETKQYITYDINGNPMPVAESDIETQAMSFKYDAEYIYASFMQAYGIDLIDQQGKLHWLKFKALLNSLPSDTALSRIVAIRQWTPSDDKKSREQAMREAQKRHKLPERS